MSWVRYLIALSLIGTIGAAAAQQTPSFFLVEYQAYRPNLFFSHDDGTDTPMFTAIRSEQAWRELWSQIEPRIARDPNQQGPHPLPPIDFTRKTLLVAALGFQPSFGYSVAFHSVIEDPARIRVNLVAVRPQAGCTGLPAITNPIALVVIPATSKPVVFSTTQSEISCR